MRVLILAPYYFPYTNPRAYRWTQIAEHWARSGWEVHVLCSRNPDWPDEHDLNGVRVHRVGFNSAKELLLRGKLSARQEGPLPWRGVAPTRIPLDPLNRILLRSWYWPDDAFWWFRPAWLKARSLQQRHAFDALVSVSLPFTAHWIGRKLKGKFPGLFWLADTGDPFALQPLHPLNNQALYRRRNRRAEEAVLRTADRTVVTNEGARRLYDEVFPGHPREIAVIPPMSSQWPVELNAGRSATSSWHLGYFGSFFPGVRMPAPLLEWFRELLRLEPQLQLHLYGELFESIRPSLGEFADLQARVTLHGLLPRSEVPAAMDQMDFLVNLGNRSDFQLPSKSADYWLAGKPIINLTQIESDTFSQFLAGHPLLLQVPVLEKQPSEKELQRCRTFLREHFGRRLPDDQRKMIAERLSPPSIARQYGQLLLSAQEK